MPAASCPDWVEHEFKRVDIGDRRLDRRLRMMVRALSQNPQGSIPDAMATWAQTKGTYRFLAHPDVTPEAILASHQAATLERLAEQPTVLLIQDTTSLNYACQAAASGLGSLGNRTDHALGLWLHTTLAVDPAGTALGLMQAQMWTRPPAQLGVAARRKQRAVAAKESQRWLDSFAESVRVANLLPGTRVINVADREGDLFELFAAAAAAPHVGVLVRARHNRRLAPHGEPLWDAIAAQPVAGTVTITVPRQPGRARQPVELELRFGPVTIQKAGATLPLWLVEARSRDGAICWRLLTNQPVADLAGATTQVAWYRQRWQIEEFHRVLKTGCRAEDRQLETVARLQNMLAVDMIIAWRVLALTRLARQEPDTPATDLLTNEEVKILGALCPRLAGRKTLKLRAAVRAIAQWGGFLARTGDGEPGPMTLWRGLRRLSLYVHAISTYNKTYG